MHSIQPYLKTPSTFQQIKILTRKNMSLFRRKRSLIIFHLSIVFFINIWIKYTNFLLATDSTTLFTETYQPYAFPTFTKCPADHKDCLSLGIILYSELETDPIKPWISNALETLKGKLDLKEETDIKVIYKGTNLTDIGNSFDKFKEIKSVIFFCNNHTFVKNSSFEISCKGLQSMGFVKVDLNLYGLIYNQTAIAPSLLKDPNTPMRIDNNALILKKLIDESIIQNNRKEFVDKNEADFEFDFQLSSYPKPKLEIFSKFDSLTVWSSFHYMFLILLSFTQFIKLISQEKTNSIRKGLEPYGLSAFAYWSSWLIFAGALNGLFTIAIAVIGYLFGAITFIEIPAYLSMTLIFTTLFAYSFLAIMITTVCPDYRSASKVAYIIFITSLFLQIFFSQNVIASMFFFDDRSNWIVAVQWILTILPSFAFTIVCNNMHFQAGYHLDLMTMGFYKGPGYTLSTYMNSLNRDIPFIGKVHRPADIYFQGIILCLIVIFAIFIFIFDHKIESNRGHTAKFINWNRSLVSPSESALNESLVANEQKSIFEISGLTKIFRSPFSKNKTFKALDKVCLNIRKNETIALLGENGAGKSTLISILTGVINSTEGQILYEGKPFNPHNHQKLLISICPQYDLLWRDLSVYENLYIIGEFKGINPQQIKKDIQEILGSLNLKTQKHTLIRNLSGGMRRRASVGMALLGNSELVIFDEPTTGLDPVNRKAVWEFIELLKKKGKTILMTTHIMDEADFLADRIAIINKGRILKIDRSIDIKNQFQKVNVIFSLRNFTPGFAEDLRDYFETNFSNMYSLKYSSEKRIKYNVQNSIENLRKLAKDFEGVGDEANENRLFENYIDSFEIAVLDLEEAYILVNEEAEKETTV